MKPIVETYIDAYSAQSGIQNYLERGYQILDKIVMPSSYHDSCNDQITHDTNIIIIFTTDNWGAQDHINEMNINNTKDKEKTDKKLKNYKEVLKESKKVNKQWESLNETLTFDNKNLAETVNKMNNKVEKAKLLEQDLVKIRNAIGDLKFNEIVGDNEEDIVNPQFP